MFSTSYKLVAISKESPSDLRLGDSEIQIWKLDLSNIYNWNPYLRLLTDEEVNKGNSFKFEINRNQFLAGKVCSKLLISNILKLPPKSIIFKKTPNDKPYLSGLPIHFNISHSKNYVIIGITKLATLGVDVEFINRDFEITKLSRRFFSQEEAKQVNDSLNTDPYMSFYKCWTKKEAFIKAHGDGLNIPLTNFQVNIHSQKSTLLQLDLNTEKANDWIIEEIAMPSNYSAAFCTNAHDYNVRFFDLV